MNRLIVFICVIALALTTKTQAQSPLFKHYIVGKNNSLKTNAIVQDQVGYIWLATENGLYKSDGDSEHSLINFPDSIDKNVTALAVDSLNRLWIGHKNGSINIIENGVLIPFDPDEGNPTSTISDLKFDQNGVLWIATYGEGIYYWTENRLFNIDDIEGLSDTYVYQILTPQDNSIWVGTDGGISILKMENNRAIVAQVIDTDDGLPDNIITSLISGKENDVWVGSESSGVIHIDSDKKISPISDFWLYDRVSSLIYRRDQLWIGTGTNNLVYDIASKSFVSIYKKGPHFDVGKINSVYEDNEKGVWIVGSQNIVRTIGNEIELFKDFKVGQNKNVVAVTSDLENNLWYTTSEGIFKRKFADDNNQTISFPIKKSDENFDFISIYADKKGKIWVGTYGNGLIVIDPKTNEYKHIQDQLPNGNILSLSGDDNSVWIATIGGATQLNIDNQEIIAHYDSKSGLLTDFIYQVFIDSKKRVWLATDGKGVELILPDKTIQHITKDNNIDTKIFYSFTEDKNGCIWMNTLDQGLYQYDGQNFKNYTQQEGLLSLDIRAIKTDINGELVVVHNEGIQTYSIENKKFTSYGNEFGVTDVYPNLNAITQNTKGEIIIGTENGIIKYSTSVNYIMDRSPSLSIIAIKVFKEEIDWTKRVEFSHDENHFEINYKGFWFRSPENLIFRYMLEGHDQEWIYTKNNQIIYSNISSGDYKLHLQIASNKNFTDFQEKSYSFKISPPFWASTWFIIAATLVIAFGIYFFFKQREKILLKRQRELEAKVEERTKKVLAQKDQIEQQHSEIVAKTKSITQSINYSKRIQNAIIPSLEEIQQDISETFMFYKPKDVVSGDFPYYYKKGDYAYYAAVDCTGHGVPGAMMSLIGYLLLNDILNDDRLLTSSEVLTELHLAIVKTLKQDAKDNTASDGMDIALCRINLTNNNIQYAGAHRPLYHVRNGELTQFKGDNFPIGGNQYKGKNSYTNHEVEIHEGDAVFFFSDGYQDQFGGPKEIKYGPKRIRTGIIDNVDKSSAEMKKFFDESYHEWMGKTKQIDDVLLIGIKF